MATNHQPVESQRTISVSYFATWNLAVGLCLSQSTLPNTEVPPLCPPRALLSQILPCQVCSWIGGPLLNCAYRSVHSAKQQNEVTNWTTPASPPSTGRLVLDV